jgi:hypothetical protein
VGRKAKINALSLPLVPGVVIEILKTTHMKPGSIVMCVDDVFRTENIFKLSGLPVRNRLYTVREILPNYEVRNGPPGVVLEEFYGKPVTFKSYAGVIVTVEVHFRMNRFREVLPPMEMEELNALLCPEPELVPA